MVAPLASGLLRVSLMKKRGLTVAEYLCHMGQAVVCANVEALRMERDLLASNDLDAEIPVGPRSVKVDGASILPEGWIGLEEMEIECESAVQVEYDADGEPTGLAMSMKRGIPYRDMHVKFRAKFNRRGTVEAFEILRDTANADLRETLQPGDS